ncbi:unnamed protein product [Dibothriocephalus latus]|uniref:Uncharacterized protein n=1 Tax=Dibothriocephalus latus TaxID=60516 RepID=A0A3P7NXM6_DIBLA|nr:unnamed protein product [Dibothriocephalus latus]
MLLPLHNASRLYEVLLSDDQKFDGWAISSAVKRYVVTMSDSLLDAEGLASVIDERLGQSLRAPAGLARTLWRMLAALTSSIDCPGGKKANDLERGWRIATLDCVIYHL